MHDYLTEDSEEKVAEYLTSKLNIDVVHSATKNFALNLVQTQREVGRQQERRAHKAERKLVYSKLELAKSALVNMDVNTALQYINDVIARKPESDPDHTTT